MRILVIAAHPQDPFERAGGTVAKHLDRGDEARFVSLTTGVVTHAFNVFPATGEDKLKDVEAVKASKRGEFEEASRIIGVTSGKVYDFHESPLATGPDEYLAIIDEIRTFRPDVVLCPHPTEYGRFDHMDAGRFAVAAVDYARADGIPSALAPHAVKDVFTFYYQDNRSDVFLGVGRHAPDVLVDITAVQPRKRAAMEIFGRTQSKPGENYSTKMDRFFAAVDGATGYAAGTGYVEQFNHLNPRPWSFLPIAQ
jgi:LmbE family N-acetylglucosaminyl deacetylase